MDLQKLPYILYRSYPEYGYLTDNRNFGYDTASKSCIKVGDLLISKTGCVFYSLLSNEMQSLEMILNQLCQLFPGVERSVLYTDAKNFYKDLTNRGFIYCTEEKERVHNIEPYFSYERMRPYVIDIQSNSTTNTIQSSEIFKEKFVLSRVHINVSGHCNERCVHCYFPLKEKNGMMSRTLFDKILLQCIDMNVLNITISGGEPMLNPNLDYFLLRCKEYNFSVNILSNLTLLTDSIKKIINDNPLISVQTSLYAMDESIHDSITCIKGSFKKTLSAIHLLRDNNIPLQINCPIIKQNRQYYKSVLDFAESLNIEASSDYFIYGCYDSSGSNLSCRLSIEDIREIINLDCCQETTRKQMSESVKFKKTDPTDEICPVCKSSLCVSNNGDLYPCEGWQRLILGNIEKSTLKEIWESSFMVKKLRSLSYKDFPECNSCENKKYCTTCLIMNANESSTGNYMDINRFMCQIANLKSIYLNSDNYNA